MFDSRSILRRLLLVGSVLSTPLVAACGDDAGDGEGGASGGAAEAPLYAMMVQVYGTDDRTVYVVLSDTLDTGDLDLADAREFAGVANFAPVGGRLLVSSGLDPSITEFEISNDLEWAEGRTVSFADFPFEDNANFYYQYILDEHTAYMPFDTTSRLLWDPTNMTIAETREDTSLELTQGALTLRVGGNRNAIRYDGPVQQAFFYSDDDYFEMSAESYVALYDPETHEESSVVALPCPGLSMATQDEDGYTYYGTWDFQVRAVFGEGPTPCVARLNPDRTLDTAWTTDLAELTDGRPVNNFRYIGRGKAIGNVFHAERFDGDLANGYDPDVAEAINQSGEHWQFWLFDLEAWQALPVDGIEIAPSTGAQFAVLDGRTFVFLPYENWGRTRIYELTDDATAVEHADTLGDVFKWVKVR